MQDDYFYSLTDIEQTSYIRGAKDFARLLDGLDSFGAPQIVTSSFVRRVSEFVDHEDRDSLLRILIGVCRENFWYDVFCAPEFVPEADQMGSQDGIRVLPGFWSDHPIKGEPQQLHVWCYHCRDFHIHGRKDGHRIAHCKEPNGPFENSGYFIREIGALPVGASPECMLMAFS